MNRTSHASVESTSPPSFDRALLESGIGTLQRADVATLQINLGKLCNQSCTHCHVAAGPNRTEQMQYATASQLMALLGSSQHTTTVDITGGAPELNPNFRYITETSRALGKHVIDRCNLTVLFEAGQQDLADFLAAHEVEIIASLPCYSEANVDGQRGRGVFNKSIRALQLLNELGYGRPDSALQLNLVYNPGAAFLPPPQAVLEAQYRTELQDQFGITFNQLFTLANLPINRFADYLERRGEAESYMQLLVDNFNPETVPHVMCRSLVSVDWQGGIYDCDFNQMVHLPTPHTNHHKAVTSIWDLESLDTMMHAPIATGHHCFGCTAGAGSSCGGALS